MTTDQLVDSLTALHKRCRTITEHDRLDNPFEAMNVVQAALNEMSTLHNLLPDELREKSWVFLSLKRGRTTWRHAG